MEWETWPHSIQVEIRHILFGKAEVVRQLVVQRSGDLSLELGLIAREALQVALEEEDAGRRLETGGRERALGPRGADE